MLDQIDLWMQIVETFVEFLLLGRMLMLKLQRVYLYLTLYAVVTLLIDASSLIVGFQSDATIRLFLYSRFLVALIYPLAAWDVFEESKATVTKVRRLHLPRMVTGIFITLVLGFVTSVGIEDRDYKGTSSTTDFIGLFLWLGSASTSLLFTWNVFRSARSAEVSLPNNTFVWAIFFLITFALSVIDCGFEVADGLIPHPALQVIGIVLGLFDLCLVAWCTVKLKPLSSNANEAPQKASL